MFFNKSKNIYATIDGTMIDIKEVKDDVFSNNLMGVGLAIRPQGNIVYAPVEGKVTLVAPTKHAFGIETKEGLQILVHLGVDTVKYQGEGFKQFIEAGQQVSAGQKVIEYNHNFFKNEGLDTSVMTIVLNHTEFKLNGLLISGEVDSKSIVGTYKK